LFQLKQIDLFIKHTEFSNKLIGVLGFPGGTRVDPFARRHRQARRAQELDHPALDRRLRPVAARDLPGALGRADIGARLRH